MEISRLGSAVYCTPPQNNQLKDKLLHNLKFCNTVKFHLSFLERSRKKKMLVGSKVTSQLQAMRSELKR